MDDQWKMLQLPLERPYKDDNGHHIPVLLDITPEGQHIYESWVFSARYLRTLTAGATSKENAAQGLGDKLRRVFIERGADFFERSPSSLIDEEVAVEEGQGDANDNDEDEAMAKFMTMEELYKMRMEILPQLL
jgi:mediator of RNA polymerase II transcription subunit 17